MLALAATTRALTAEPSGAQMTVWPNTAMAGEPSANRTGVPLGGSWPEHDGVLSAQWSGSLTPSAPGRYSSIAQHLISTVVTTLTRRHANHRGYRHGVAVDAISLADGFLNSVDDNPRFGRRACAG